MSAAFAPVFTARYDDPRRRLTKQRHEHDEDEDEGTSDEDQSRSRPLNRKDPYYIAGWSREKPLPPYPFPHAAQAETASKDVAVDEQLLAMDPPVLVWHKNEQNADISSRRHFDNLTTLLHRCVKAGEWDRASRCMSLLLRSERQVDFRQNGFWMIAAEILIRSHANQEEGLKIARQFYERLIIQYPPSLRAIRTWNATVVYPSLFNIWIYEVQHRSKTAREERLSQQSPTWSVQSPGYGSQDDHVVRQQELDDANEIIEKLEQLVLMPPYDTDVQLQGIRTSLYQWVSGLHDLLGEPQSGSHDGRPDNGGSQHQPETASEFNNVMRYMDS